MVSLREALMGGVNKGLRNACRPSKINVTRRSRNRIVSSTHRSSPYNAFSTESSIFELRISLFIESELRHRVDNRPVSVDMDTVTVGAAADLDESLAVNVAGDVIDDDGFKPVMVDWDHLFALFICTESPSLRMSSSTSPYLNYMV